MVPEASEGAGTRRGKLGVGLCNGRVVIILPEPRMVYYFDTPEDALDWFLMGWRAARDLVEPPRPSNEREPP